MFREIVTGSVLDNNKALFATMLEIEPDNCYTETKKGKIADILEFKLSIKIISSR